MFKRASIFVALALALTAPLPALACSVASDYRVPTNLELAGEAQLVLLARVTGGSSAEADPTKWSITLHPIAAIKGDLPAGDLTLPGATLASERFLVLSNPYELEAAHPLSYIGGCIRYLFPRGTTALFFLKQDDGAWGSAGGPFSRWAEDVPGADAPWVRLAQLYARASAMPEDQRKAALEAEQARLAAQADDPVAQLMAADVARQLKGPNPAWNSLMERQLQAMGMGEGTSESGDERADQGSEDDAGDRINAVDATLEAMKADPAEAK